MNTVDVRSVEKTFGRTRAVDGLSFSIPEGALYGFIGPNGSGKPTTLRMIMNILMPDAGDIEIFGRTRRQINWDRIGYLPEERGLYKKMKVRSLLRYYGRLKGKRSRELNPEIDQWLDRMDLLRWGNKKVGALSKGMAQKVQFIATAIFSPDLLILDEPFSGLDPVNLEVVRNAMLEMKQNGTTIIFSTHDMHMAEIMCDHVLMIFHGHKVLDGTVEDIRASHGRDTVRIRIEGGTEFLNSMPGIENMRDLGNFQEIRINGEPQEFLRRVCGKTDVYHFEITTPNLHDIFLRLARPPALEGT